ncbi:AMP-binding protein [Auritidibacter ignavus]|uniref:AMP-binding protein n=1 Tax=Auritidibacter TaxID=1160973 RepID=UPI000D73D469|nr:MULTISPECIES: AMP-binding protein [Auritidibacter]AXR73881.1 AMP-dependent synthetase [Auritidibacter sp. NML130574]PXA75184.1 AMP-dependent synthetase [Auritidibacter sp. NML120779]PXA80077.1 AMP-dependent synthetase [Auritidibacter sp. NML120636]WGH82583.1 AMP-binding protein [Auritidibacter ignavus]
MSATETFRAARDQLLSYRTDIQSARENFRWPEFEHFNFALDWVDHVAYETERGDHNALVIVEEDGSSTRLTYRELADRSSQVANWLRSLGVQRGDGVMVMLNNQVELWETMLAGIKLGAVLLPTTVMLSPHDLQERIDRSEARWVVVNPDNAEKFEAVTGEMTVITTGTTRSDTEAQNVAHPRFSYVASFDADIAFTPDQPTPADDTVLLYFTSGTTSRAKMVAHSHLSYPVGHFTTVYWIGLEPGDVHLNVASPGWAKHAWSNFFAPLIAEATIFLYNYSRFDAEKLMQVMDDEGVTSFCAPPTVWRMLIQADLTKLKNPPDKVVAAGEPLNPRVINKVREDWNRDIRDGFGQTESTLQIANTPGQELKPGSVGRPLPGFEVVLIDPATDELIEGAGEGEVCLVAAPRPVGLMKGYYKDPEKNDKAFRGGYYHTGDIMERDEQGIFTYIGRADDVFKASDYKLSPFELESAVIEHPAVAEVAVVPSPDPIRLSVPKAYVVLAAGHEPTAETAASIFAHTSTVLPPYAKIRRLEFAELPKTVSGKIRRVELRAKEREFHGEEGELTDQARATRTSTEGYNHEFSDTDVTA